MSPVLQEVAVKLKDKIKVVKINTGERRLAITGRLPQWQLHAWPHVEEPRSAAGSTLA